jgi:hypothetical protein
MNSFEQVNIEQSGQAPPEPTTVEEKLHPAPRVGQIVEYAFREAGIQGLGGSNGVSNDPMNTITIYVGLRPRDKWAVLPPSRYKGVQENPPPDITDDDFLGVDKLK